MSAPARIAIIDDDVVFLELMNDLLALGEGYEVVTNSRWQVSLDFVRNVRPDLVMLDLMMGREQNGWAILESLRQDPATSHIPVIVCSAAAPALDQHADRLRHGRVSALAKPFDVEKLLSEVDRLLKGHTTSEVTLPSH
jgi:CheY-like chemotaxis protein